MKKRLIIAGILFVIILLLGIFLFSNLIDYVSVLEKQELYTRVIVSDKIGIDVNDSALIFGVVMPGSGASRDLDIENNHNQDVQIEVYVKGEIEDFMSISENNFILKKRETRKISFPVYIPGNIEFGTYDGKIIIIVRNIIVK